MQLNRRAFLKITGGLGISLSIVPGIVSASHAKADERVKKAKKFGLQLYSLRDVLPQDPKGVLKQVASYGYKQIEGYEGPSGIFWGMSNTAFKKYMDELGMEFIASHCNIDKDFDKKAAEAAAIGMKYLICPSRGANKTKDDFKRVADDFNAKGEICKKNGIRFAYHNHEYGFNLIEDEYPQDILMKNTDADLVDFEMDIYWVVTGKQDPIEWLNKYPKRFKLGHVKDRIEGSSERGASCILGTGSIQYPPIIDAAKKNGMKYFIVEQERYDNTTPLKAVEADAGYMRKLNL